MDFCRISSFPRLKLWQRQRIAARVLWFALVNTIFLPRCREASLPRDRLTSCTVSDDQPTVTR